ncbi:hypothetical protein XELAEV_18016833mg [Xenopus laevis]|uniref:Paraneoplastic antigen Ma-like C-terminal domain-containing protein n=1 Tax=Xenopus laevis TaxID=8355 RepID=A0A974DAH0_XENLA|nr:hypothetical protein XELAEV_18016833mg [Xenopus laevis]
MFDADISAFETPQSVRQWCTKLGLKVDPSPKKNGEQMFYRPKVAESWRDSARLLLNVLIESPRWIDCERDPPDIDAEIEGPWKIILPDMSEGTDELTSQGDALTSQFAVKAPESVPLNKTLFNSPSEKSQIKSQTLSRSCESVVSKGSRHSSGGQLDTPEIVSTLRQELGHPDATSGDLIEVLEVMFGPVESVTKIYRFHSTFQKEKEDLSAYLVRLEQGHTQKSPADAKLLEENKKLRKELEELKAQLSERAKPPAEAKKVPKPNCPVPDELETQSALCKVHSSG